MAKDASLPVWAEKNVEQKIDALQVMFHDLYGYILHTGRTRLLEDLAKFQPESEIEKKHIETIKEHVENYPNIFSRNCEIGHLIGSALIIAPKSGKILLHFHKRLGKWLQFGGHSNYHEIAFAEVAMHHAREETGLTDLTFYPDPEKPFLLDVDVHEIPQTNTVPKHQHLDLRYLVATNDPDKVFTQEGATNRKEGESSRFKWLTFEETKGEPILDDLRRLISKAEKVYLKATATVQTNTETIQDVSAPAHDDETK